MPNYSGLVALVVKLVGTTRERAEIIAFSTLSIIGVVIVILLGSLLAYDVIKRAREASYGIPNKNLTCCGNCTFYSKRLHETICRRMGVVQPVHAVCPEWMFDAYVRRSRQDVFNEGRTS